MSVPFNDPFNAYYDQFSLNVSNFAIPEHFDIFVPDNQNDYNCVSVIAPNPAKGAKKWTLNGQWITIGVYRDEGRGVNQKQPTVGLTWTRSGLITTMTDPAGHGLKVGDPVNVWNINVPALYDVPVLTVIDAYSFTFRGAVIGVTSGTGGAYQPNFSVNFYESHRVFRLLPSFKLLPLTVLNQIFSDSAPTNQAARRSMYNITTSTTVKMPNGKSKSINYELPNTATPLVERTSLLRRFGQVYDENGQPYKLQYLDDGYTASTDNVDSYKANMQLFMSSPRTNEVGGIPGQNSRVYIYDYYGLDLNDSTRGPTNSETNVIADPNIAGSLNNIYIKQVNNRPVIANYSGTFYDEYGNLAVGIQSNKALIVRKQILPLELNVYNQPVKSPL